jgi:hypothetical protein
VTCHGVDAVLWYANDRLDAVCPILGPLSQIIRCLAALVMLLRHTINNAVSCHFVDSEVYKIVFCQQSPCSDKNMQNTAMLAQL